MRSKSGPAFDNLPGALAREETPMIQASGIDHIVLHCSDVRLAKTFYTEILGMTVYSENDGQVFLHAGGQGVALFKKQIEAPLTAGNDLNHLALNVAGGTYETLKAELESHGVAVGGRPGDDHCIYFRDPDGHRLQLMFGR
jgi:glyoxylase I family protein